jgi:hypothetical protein
MSTTSLKNKRTARPVTDEKWLPTTRGLNRWINRMADRADLAVRVLKHTSGAPARFVPTEAEIDINEGLIARIDPLIAGSPDFIIKHRAIAGACIHESAHARYSKMDLPKIGRRFGHRHTETFAMLEEGRCESKQWPNLSAVEKLALQSMVLEIVLRDMEDEDGNVNISDDIRALIRLTGLLAARMENGIVDITQPVAARLHDHLVEGLGANYAALYKIAVEFSTINIGWYESGEDRMHELVREWMEIEDSILPPDEGGDSGEGEGEGEGEGGSGEGEGSDEGDESGESGGKSKSKGEGDSEGESAGSSEGDGESKSDKKPSVGDDDEGKVGDGSKTLEQNDGTDSEGSLGQYASSNADGGPLEDIFDAIREAAEEAEHVSGSRLKEQVTVIHRATAAAHAERRRRNQEAMKKWRA